MDVVVQAHTSTGVIQGVYRSAAAGFLVPENFPADATYTYVLVETEATDQELQAYYYLQGGVLTPKTELTITANPPQFIGDGVAHSAITVVPFVPCTLLVNDTPAVLTVDDQVLELTSMVPQIFLITLQDRADSWATPITVEAT